MQKYLDTEILKIVEHLFEELDLYGIDVEMNKEDLDHKKLEQYNKIYSEYEKQLIELKNKIILKYGNVSNIDYIFGLKVQNAVVSKQASLNKGKHSI